jgi:hypothetical protein
LSLPVDETIWVGAERLDPTGVPGHHRPTLSKQLKCQSLRCGRRHPQPAEDGPENFSCDIAARLACDFAAESARIAAETRRF